MSANRNKEVNRLFYSSPFFAHFIPIPNLLQMILYGIFDFPIGREETQ